MLCPNCKAEVDRDALFCPHCALSLAETKRTPEITAVRSQSYSKAVALTVAAAAILLTTVAVVGLIVFYYGSDWFGPKAQIVGDVSDGFGAPLRDATVSIEGTTFRSVTSRNGHYGIQYVPGKIKMSVNKEGYWPISLDFDIATESKFPAQPVTLIKIPESQGLWFLGTSDYLPLRKGRISEQKQEFSFSWDNPLVTCSYIAQGEFVLVDHKSALKFMDNDPNVSILVKVKEGGLVFRQVRYWLKTEDKFDPLNERATRIQPETYIREVSLEKGKYAFVTIKSDEIGTGGPSYLRGPPVGEPVYLFEVR